MKKNLSINIAALMTILIISSCNNGDTPPEIPTYSYSVPVVNPPAKFNIVYYISSDGNKVSDVTFEQNAVWIIEKLGDSRVNLTITNQAENLGIVARDTLGLQANMVYHVTVNNNSYTDYTNYFIGFTKLELDYESFNPKF